MKTDILADAAALSDQDLLARLDVLAARERGSTAELVAHLAALDTRPALYAAQGYGSLFSYCRQALRLSEDAACNRIEAARAGRRFPVILDLLAEGTLSLTCVRLVARHLTPENHQAVLSRAGGRPRREVEALVAQLAPRPDVASAVRRLPPPNPSATSGTATIPPPPELGSPSEPVPVGPSPAAFRHPPRPIVRASAPARYRVQFTMGEETHEKLRRLQALLRREIPDGDPGTIFDRAITQLLDKVEKTKLGRVAKPRTRPAIRPGTDDAAGGPASRHVTREVRRAVWRRDEGRCGFVSTKGSRCTETTFLEFHHIQPYALNGPAAVANIALRCRRHNQYEADLVFGRTALGREYA